MFSLSFLSHKSLNEVFIVSLVSDPEVGAEEEVGGDLGQEGDQDAHLNLYVWIHQETPVGTRQQ